MEALPRGGPAEPAVRTLEPSGKPAGAADSVAVLKGLDAVDRLAPAWNELADAVGAAASLRPEWVQAWHRAFGRGGLEIVTVRRGGRLVGVVPMQRRNGELRSTSNYHTPSFGLLAADAAALETLATALIRTSPRRLTVAFVPEEDPSLAALQAASRQARRPTVVRVLERCPYLMLDGTWEELLATRRHQFARELKRRLRRIHSRGDFETDLQDGSEDLDRYLEEGFAIEASGWKGKKGTAIASSPNTRGFYREIARWLASRGSLRLSYLRLDGVAFAVEIAFEENGRYSLLKSGYDESYRSDAPGVLIRAAAIQGAFARGLRRYDFLGKEDAWKREWTSTVEVQVQFQSFGRTPDGVADWAAQRYLRPIARRFLKRR
ncbi:MAG TPA: GNAT family N-acetyltransferase [Candidatus Eisenbacteria bacterium]|nr:GNAT family N-acetyltransferase [Candidatus Eisenbacteria bacterium]